MFFVLYNMAIIFVYVVKVPTRERDDLENMSLNSLIYLPDSARIILGIVN